MKLKKQEGIQWSKLEGTSDEEVVVAPTAIGEVLYSIFLNSINILRMF